MNQYDYKILWLKIQQNIMDTTSVIESGIGTVLTCVQKSVSSGKRAGGHGKG